MQPVLIYKDQKTIDEQLVAIERPISYMQEVYDKFDAIGVKFSLQEISDIIAAIWNQGGHLPGENNSVATLFIDKLLAKPENSAFASLPIKKEKLIDLMDIPEITTITYWIQNNAPANTNLRYGLGVNYLQIVNDKISKKLDTDQIINDKYTYYTKNDRGAEVANNIIEFAQNYNITVSNFEDYSETDKIPFAHQHTGAEPGKLEEFTAFIREQEAAFPDYVAN